jgi:hypothetical protein
MKKERQDETQITTKINGFHPTFNTIVLFCRFFKKNLTLCMTKLRVLVLCFSYFNSNIWKERPIQSDLLNGFCVYRCKVFLLLLFQQFFKDLILIEKIQVSHHYYFIFSNFFLQLPMWWLKNSYTTNIWSHGGRNTKVIYGRIVYCLHHLCENLERNKKTFAT